MSTINHTKQELKAQRDALGRYERFRPTLRLKEYQLQHEMKNVEAKLRNKREEISQFNEELNGWITLFDTELPFDQYLRIDAFRRSEGNIAGVAIPVFSEVTFVRSQPDLFMTPPWLDDGIQALEQSIQLQLEVGVLHEQRRLLAEELRVTTQRVNLFEKVKIPECRENIREIRIFLGDQQTADVVRSKIAKKKGAAQEVSA